MTYAKHVAHTKSNTKYPTLSISTHSGSQYFLHWAGTFIMIQTIKVFNLHFYLRKTNEEVEKIRKIGFIRPIAWSVSPFVNKSF